MLYTALTLLYITCAILLTLYTSGQIVLLIAFWRYRNRQIPLPEIDTWPTVTIQLPIYNERHVVTRLLDAVAALDYPRDQLRVQVLDDSSDDTSALVALLTAKLRCEGLDIQHIRRETRTGYKAGALAYGASITDSEIMLVLDADFVLPPDFLRRTVPYMVADPGLGIVQTRWGHLNAGDNWITRAQALSVDAHFVVEQTARNRAGLLLTFNGSGGLWRADCIREAGGWRDDTLTEDLDLSYRAQLAGWRYLFLPEVAVPGELPPQLAAYKRQQARWAKGSVQCLIRLTRPVWRGRGLTLVQRIMTMQHLCQYLPHLLMLMLLLLTPVLLVTGGLQNLALAPLGLVGLAPPLMYAVGQQALYRDWKSRMMAFPALMILGTGMIWNNTRAVLEALFDRSGEFRRTPKFGQRWQASSYALSGDGTTWIEAALAVYALWGTWLTLNQEPSLAPYLALYAVSLSAVALWGLWERWNLRRQRAHHFKQAAPPAAPEQHLS
jgi:cellulose synthase/poly-beta-1,6-N-acetylglucosamine synthase-like glycosyltransferase